MRPVKNQSDYANTHAERNVRWAHMSEGTVADVEAKLLSYTAYV